MAHALLGSTAPVMAASNDTGAGIRPIGTSEALRWLDGTTTTTTGKAVANGEARESPSSSLDCKIRLRGIRFHQSIFSSSGSPPHMVLTQSDARRHARALVTSSTSSSTSAWVAASSREATAKKQQLDLFSMD